MKRTIKDLGRDVHEIAQRIVAIEELLAPAIAHLRSNQPGYPTGAGVGGGSSLNEDGTPVGLERFVFRRDPAAEDLEQLDRLLLTCRRQTAEVHRLVAVWATESDRGEPSTNGGECVACGRFCAGAHEDRLRAGLCPACRTSWTRWRSSNKGDRFDWLRGRRAEISEQNENSIAS